MLCRPVWHTYPLNAHLYKARPQPFLYVSAYIKILASDIKNEPIRLKHSSPKMSTYNGTRHCKYKSDQQISAHTLWVYPSSSSPQYVCTLESSEERVCSEPFRTQITNLFDFIYRYLQIYTVLLSWKLLWIAEYSATFFNTQHTTCELNHAAIYENTHSHYIPFITKVVYSRICTQCMSLVHTGASLIPFTFFYSQAWLNLCLPYHYTVPCSLTDLLILFTVIHSWRSIYSLPFISQIHPV